MPRLCALQRGRRLPCFACLAMCALFAVCCVKLVSTETEATPRENSTSADDSWALAPNAQALEKSNSAHVAESSPVTESEKPSVDSKVTPVSKYWGTSDDTQLVRLPCIDEAESAELTVPATEPLDNSPAPQANTPAAESDPWDVSEPAIIGAEPKSESLAELPSATDQELHIPMPEPVAAPVAEDSGRAIELPKFEYLSSEERHLLELITSESLSAATGTLTDAKLDEECRIKISAAYALSQRGAAYAAREELVGVLRLISQAKDARDGTRSRSESLAAGLRAIEEAADFVPRGSQLEAEMNLDVICAAHRTPLARELNLAEILPSRMTERYHRYAQIKLAVAVAGEPAGSMALYSLGKLNSLLNATEGEQHPLAAREAVAFQQAALLAHNENYMAAHELGVLLAESGHFPEAQHMLLQVAAEQPNSVVFRNLARVQEALGNRTEAQMCQSEASRLAGQGRGPKPNVSWVSPQEFSRDQMNNFTPQVASRPAAPTPSAPAVIWR